MEKHQRKSDEEVTVDFDYVLINSLGQFGYFQLRNILLIAILILFTAFMFGEYVFTAAKLQHRCFIPECDSPDPTYKVPWMRNAIPKISPSKVHDCKRYNTSSFTNHGRNEECPASIFDTNRLTKCESYVYVKKNSVVYDFGLECQEWLRSLAGMLNSMGNLISLPIAGFVSDQYGRRVTILFSIFGMAAVGFIRSFSTSYVMYASLQFLQTAIGGGAFSAGYILATELVGPKYRVTTSAFILTMFSAGEAILGLIAWTVAEWRMLILVLHVPMFFLLVYYWLLTESVRWLLSKSRYEEAKIVLQNVNKYKDFSDLSMETGLIQPSDNVNYEQKGNSNVFFIIIQSRTLFYRCLITFFWWVTMTLIYYGLSINSVMLFGNMYFNYIASAAIDIPGYWIAVVLLTRLGRRPTIFYGFIVNSACCLTFAFMPSHLKSFSKYLFLFAKFCIAIVASSIYLYTSELYPTRYRHTLLAFSSMVGRIGSMIAPMTPPLIEYWEGAPSFLFGLLAFLAGFMVLTQPETLGVKFPDTMEESRYLGQKITQIPLKTL